MTEMHALRDDQARHLAALLEMAAEWIIRQHRDPDADLNLFLNPCGGSRTTCADFTGALTRAADRLRLSTENTITTGE